MNIRNFTNLVLGPERTSTTPGHPQKQHGPFGGFAAPNMDPPRPSQVHQSLILRQISKAVLKRLSEAVSGFKTRIHWAWTRGPKKGLGSKRFLVDQCWLWGMKKKKDGSTISHMLTPQLGKKQQNQIDDLLSWFYRFLGSKMLAVHLENTLSLEYKNPSNIPSQYQWLFG